MKTIINGSAPFQVLTQNFSIGPADAYTLQISADGQNFSDLFSVGADVTRMVSDVAAGSFYRLAGNNRNGVVINWMKSCGEGGGSGEAGVASLNGQKGNLTLKTINGNDLLGGGNIEIEGGSSDILKSRTDFPEDAQNGDVVATKDGVYQNNKTENIEEVFNSQNVRLQTFNKMMQVCVQNTDQSYVQYVIKSYPDKESYDRDENYELKYGGLWLGMSKRTEGGEGNPKFTFLSKEIFWDGEDPLPDKIINHCPIYDAEGNGILYSGTWPGELCEGGVWDEERLLTNTDWVTYSQGGTTIRYKWDSDAWQEFYVEILDGDYSLNSDWQEEGVYHQEGGSETFYDLFYSTDGHNLITLHTFADDAYGETAVGEINVPYDIPGDFQYVAKVGYEVHYGEETPEFTKYILHSVEDADVNGLSRLVINGTNASNGWWYAERKVSADNWTAIGGGSSNSLKPVSEAPIDTQNGEVFAAYVEGEYGIYQHIDGNFHRAITNEDGSISSIKVLSQEEYDNLEEKDEKTFYIIRG